jgi:hypothetical protein
VSEFACGHGLLKWLVQRRCSGSILDSTSSALQAAPQSTWLDRLVMCN